jgi:predicted ATP-dependent endonuclease of OLD family
LRLSAITIKNFRSIKDLTTDLPQVCALVGPNNSGKSNLLEAIHRVIGREWVTVNSFSEDDVFGRDPGNDILIKLSFDPPLSYTKFVHGEGVQIATLSFEYTRYVVGSEKGHRRLEQKCYAPNGKPPMVLTKAPRKGEQRQYVPLVNIPSELRESVPLIFIGTSRAVKDQLPAARSSLLRTLLEDVNRDFNDPAQEIEIEEHGTKKQISRRDWFSHLMGRVLGLLRTKQFDSLEKSIKTNALRQLGFDPDVDADKLDFYFAPFDTLDFYKSLELRVREFGASISATELGDGFQNALVLSILQAFEERRKKGAILLIEEPEMFLHPQMQRALYKTLRKIGETNQVIFTTHSPHFVSVPEYYEVIMTRKGADGTRAFRSTLKPAPKLHEKFVKELDPERNELFFASRLLLVEGDTEKLAIPEYAKRLKYDLDSRGATVVEVGGKRNLPAFLDLAESFAIPIGVVYDAESSDFGKDRKEDEKQFNEALDARAKTDGSVQVWRLKTNYEDHLRRALGETKYLQLCEKYPFGKPTRARLIAQEDLPVPEPFQEVLAWLAGEKSLKPETSTSVKGVARGQVQ